MAHLNNPRIFAFTSPRTIEKIIPEITILAGEFEGAIWDTETQTIFFERLFESDAYEGGKRPKDPAFAARDRITRAPKALGFVDLTPTIHLTEVGRALLWNRRKHEVIARQLFKFQLPSPYHSTPPGFNVRPYLELLRLCQAVGSLSKTEIAMFFIQMTNYRMFDEVVNEILEFRKAAQANKTNRKEFVDEYFTSVIKQMYAEQIAADKLKVRENTEVSLTNFIKKQKGNHVDYADAFMRYLRATQLVSFDRKTFRMVISPSRSNEVDYILHYVQRDAIKFGSIEEFKEYLFSPYSLKLLTDERKYLKDRLTDLSVKFKPGADIDQLKELLEDTEEALIKKAIKKETVALKNYKEFDEIVDTFRKIEKREMPDPSLYLEWNVWRSLVMMNYAKEVKGNFMIDLDGVPLNTALGNLPDIEVDYEDFKMIVEVTLSSGNKQYEMEGEPVARHFGKIQNVSDKPVYCLFLAPKISDGTLAHFYNLNRMNTKAYGGKTRIVPMNINQFVQFITVAKNGGFNDPGKLKRYLKKIIRLNSSSDDETVWYSSIGNMISTWVS